MRICGVILAGGAARRMGGGDKTLLEIGGVTILDRVISRLAPQVDLLAVSANGEGSRFAPRDLPVIADEFETREGPLAGVLAGMGFAAERGAGHILAVAGDTPFIPADLCEKLKAAAGAGAAIASSAGRRHPACALWPVSLGAELRAALLGGERRLGRFADAAGAQIVEFPAAPYDPFLNVNAPDDLAKAEAVAAAHGL